VSRRALITGVAGQDGTYLCDLLLSRGYEVWGIVGPAPGDFRERAAAIDGLHALEADMTDTDSLLAAVETSRPDEIYNLASVSSVAESWTASVVDAEVNAVGLVRLLEALRLFAPAARLFQASSADMFGETLVQPQTEATPLCPRSPYAIAKTYAHTMVRAYRESYHVYAACGILYNHESPLRSPQFVTAKITRAAARIKLGLESEVRLGNLDARRDWGFAGDYVEAMWLMLQQDLPDDFIVASGETHSVREFCQAAFEHVGLDWERHVVVDPKFFRPVDPTVLCGDPSKAHRVLGWAPKVGFRELVGMMIDTDLVREAPALGSDRG